MIAFKGGKQMRNGRRRGKIPSFVNGMHYLRFGTYGPTRRRRSRGRGKLEAPSEDRVVWSATRNLPTDNTTQAAQLMHSTAATNDRVRDPGYHFGVSLHPDETLSQRQWERVAEVALRRLGLEEHQAIIALHGDRDHEHLHVIANRVHHDGPVWKPSYDELILTTVMRELELEMGLSVVPTLGDRRARGGDRVGGDRRRHEQRLAGRRIRIAIQMDLQAARSWRELEDGFAERGLALAPGKRGGGVVIVDGDERIDLSKIGRGLSGPRLAKRFGETLRVYRDRQPVRPTLAQRVRDASLPDAEEEAERVFQGLARHRATWTRRDIEIAVAHRPDHEEMVERVVHAKGAQRVAIDGNGAVRFTAQAYLEAERRLFDKAPTFGKRARRALRPEQVRGVLDEHHAVLSAEQRRAVLDATAGSDLAFVIGAPGTGKTTVVRAVADTYQRGGTRVRIATSSARAARDIEAETGAPARSMASWRWLWEHDRSPAVPGDVFVVDDAGMASTEDTAAVLDMAAKVGGKVILVGDPHQLQPMGAGTPLRGLLHTHPHTRLEEPQRQKIPWQRITTRHVGNDKWAAALDGYRTQDRLDWSPTRDDAVRALADAMVDTMANAEQHGPGSTLAIAATRADVARINDAIRRARRERGLLGDNDVTIRGHAFAEHDRVSFTQSSNLEGPTGVERVLPGDRGTVIGLHGATTEGVAPATPDRLHIELDRGGVVEIDPSESVGLEHGYATTVHRAQGEAVDRAFVLASEYFDRHQASVAMTRHRRDLHLFADRESFPQQADLDRVLTRGRAKDLVVDYGRFADGLTIVEKAADRVRDLEKGLATWTAEGFTKGLQNGDALLEVLHEVDGVIELSTDHYTTRRYLEAELALYEAGDGLHREPVARIDSERMRSWAADHELSPEQAVAAQHAIEHRLALVTGRAGSGKTRMTRALVAHFEDEGLRVRGAALAGKAAEGLAQAAGVEADTLAAWLARWDRQERKLTSGDVFLVDEAGMVDVKTLARVLREVRQADARVVLLGDPHQLKAIDAGDAFRGLIDRYGAAEIKTIHRQEKAWMKEASHRMAVGDVQQALNAYADHGAITFAANETAAKVQLVDRYFTDRYATGNARGVVLAYRRKDVADLNRMIRQARRDAGEIQGGVRFRGRQYSVGDRVLLGANDAKGKAVRVLEGEGGVRNGSLGTIVAIEKTEMRVRLDDHRLVAFDPKNYHRFAHGYATTIHKAQGITIDRAYLLADTLVDRSAAYVGLTRHRKALQVAVPRSAIQDLDALAEAFSKVPRKDLVLDHISRPRAETLLAEERTMRPHRETRLDPRLPHVVGNPEVRLAAIRRILRDLDALNVATATRERLSLELGGASVDDRPALLRALRDAERRLATFVDHEQFHVDLAAQVASFTPKEITRLPPGDRQLVTKLRAEQDIFLRDILEKVTAFEKATPGTKDQRVAANAISYLMRSAKRRVVYRLTPRAVRSVLRASWMVKAPIGMLYHLSPPMVRPVVHGVMLARTVVRGVRRGLG